MFVPIVPFVPHTTVVNKTIVYSDTVLPLKDPGNNLVITSIEDVSEYSLESCLKTIFQSNPNVIFNTIQYSKNDNKVYFYTNQEITIKKFEENKFKKYKPISSRSEILEEVNRLLTSEKTKDNNCISLYDISILMSKVDYKLKNIEDNYKRYFNNIIKSKFSNSSSIIIYDFDYENNELIIGFKYVGDDYNNITFVKKDGDLYISKSKSYWAKELLVAIGGELAELYDEFMKFSACKNQTSYGISAVNSSFLVDVDSYGVDIFTKSPTNEYMKNFELTLPSYVDEYKYDCNSVAVISALKGKENEIFKRIFIKISDCPEWCQAMLYEIRQNQLAEEQKIENEIKYIEMKKQKRLELTRKIFPFLKK